MTRRLRGGARALTLIVATFAACGKEASQHRAPAATVQPMHAAAEAYVKLALAVGRHDRDYVDAYYGPEEWKKQAEAAERPLASIREEAVSLVAKIEALPEPAEELIRLRRLYLSRQLQALIARVEMLSGTKLSFDEESKSLYDAVAPSNTEEHFRELQRELDPLLPGPGTLIERYEAFRNHFLIPKEKLKAVFAAAIEACRERTLRHILLPPNESFTVEYVTGKSWSAYNWYQGGFQSLIQVNTDLPISIDRAIDLACHEGYPGHHVYNALLEKNLVRDRGWVEFSIYPLFSPQSLVAEGSANFGIEVAFSGKERVDFEEKTLFPLAGLDPKRAEEYDRVHRLVERLAYAGNEAARRYLDGEISAEAAADWLSEFALMPRDRAKQRVRFFDQYRSYVINYNLGKDLVRRYVESRGGTPDRLQKRWKEFEKLLSSPRLPSGLQPAAGEGSRADLRGRSASPLPS